MKILVIDGQGGRLGRKLTESIRKSCPAAFITAVGTNSIATSAMMNSDCADRLATGENAVIVACRTADMGEISPAMANAVSSSPAYRVLIPMNLCSTYVAGVSGNSAAILEDAIKHIRTICEKEDHDRKE